MPSDIVVEGHVDFAIINALDRTLPVVRPAVPSGRDAAIRRAALAAKQVGSRQIVLVLDRNGHTEEELRDEVQDILSREWGIQILRHGEWYLYGASKLRLVLTGIPDSPVVAEFGLVKFT